MQPKKPNSILTFLKRLISLCVSFFIIAMLLSSLRALMSDSDNSNEVVAEPTYQELLQKHIEEAFTAEPILKRYTQTSFAKHYGLTDINEAGKVRGGHSVSFSKGGSARAFLGNINQLSFGQQEPALNVLKVLLTSSEYEKASNYINRNLSTTYDDYAKFYGIKVGHVHVASGTVYGKPRVELSFDRKQGISDVSILTVQSDYAARSNNENGARDGNNGASCYDFILQDTGALTQSLGQPIEIKQVPGNPTENEWVYPDCVFIVGDPGSGARGGLKVTGVRKVN